MFAQSLQSYKVKTSAGLVRKFLII